MAAWTRIPLPANRTDVRRRHMDALKAGLAQRIFAWALARFNKRYEQFVSNYKRQLFAGIRGTVLELGAGTGANLRYMPPEQVRWTGVELNPFMTSYLRREANRVNLPVSMLIAPADTLPVRDSSVDAVISTLVLCCVPSPQRCLQDVLRVLKPGGKFLFIEHVAAPQGSRLRRIQNLVTPGWKRLGDGCHPNRQTLGDIEAAGFESVSYREITAPTPIVSPQIAGVAAKARPV